MRECPNTEMRDLLPDLLHGRLQGDARAPVTAHVASCPDCRAELQLLTTIRSAVLTPQLDAGRISRALPAYRSTGFWQRQQPWAPMWIAAGLVLAVGSVVLLRRETVPDTGINSAMPAIAAAPTPELTVGDGLVDLTENDLRELIDELDELDAVTPVESELDAPIGGIE